MADLTIGEVARRAGMNASVVRYYESMGLLPAPKRVNGHRRYGADVMQKLSIIAFAQKAGFTLTEIKTLFQGIEAQVPAGERWRALARQKILEVDESIRHAQHRKQLLEKGMDCTCSRLEDCRIAGDEQHCERE